MLLSNRFVELIHWPTSAIWAANANQKLVPDLVRLMGVQVGADREHVLFYVSSELGKNFLKNLTITRKLTFLLAVMETNESYQLKGTYVAHQLSTKEEIHYQTEYLRVFCDDLERQGLPREKAYRAYYRPPAVTVSMRVEEIYEQTPKVGTGTKLF